ncbi:hypothetical protein [Nocardia puris]|uniref:Uncharacterized protein n=1 Tax=Nocardia puris TaxID=208602 RepID=A0A366CXZ0_9NOCA|nr:hypothetical protein [Nocardia puris]RBO82079.1 hypothetical protein DFR74_12534 [Nocardia puris]
MRICDHCADEIPASKHRSAKYCSLRCQKDAAKLRQQPAAPVVKLPMAAEPGDPLTDRVRAELEAAGRLDTVLGQQAAALAAAMAAAGGQAMAALSRELRSVMDEALRGAKAEVDPIDELKLRRDRKSG